MASFHFLRHLPVETVEFLLLVGFGLLCSQLADAQTGACYGILGNNLPSPPEVVSLCHQHGIRAVRIYNPNQSILQALNGSGISVMIGIPNENILLIGKSPPKAQAWVQYNIRRFPGINFKYVVVGNEINPLDPAFAAIAPYIGPAMENINSALFGHGQTIKVSTAISTGLLAQSYPPSAGAFRGDISGYIGPIIDFLKKQNSPLLANVYPYLDYIGDTRDISLEYALFTSPSPVVIDGPYRYQNLFDAMLDAVHAALEKYGANDVGVVVSETGWPSAGGPAASVENAGIYNNKLVGHVGGGTPRRPGRPVETYISDLIDENQKSPEYEKHWGVFYPNKQPKYPIRFSSHGN
ncbi:glucan endo-1,3-beta-glucosidase, basic isoform-like [Henckelia pumila]|uniref:glucan endo-1,3-beta-glucosidase, basic isoform-like n=1 Tax=Henckelia pumila TaxID=405737 RepID=UPI003C6E2925